MARKTKNIILKFKNLQINKYLYSVYLSVLIIFLVIFPYWIFHTSESLSGLIFAFIFFGGLVSLLLPAAIILIIFVTVIYIFFKYEKEKGVNEIKLYAVNFILLIVFLAMLFIATAPPNV